MSLTINLKAFSLSGFTFVGGTAVLPANSRTHVGVRVADKVVVQTPAATNVGRSVIWLATCTTTATDVTLCIEHDPLMQIELAELAPISGADFLSFNQNPSGVPETPGTIYWDPEELCFAFRGKSTGTVCQIGRELWARVRNNSGVDIPDGAAVVVTGAIGGYPTVRLASALTDTHLDTLGVTTEAIAKNAFGEVTTAGDVNGLAIPSGWAEGDTLYLSNSPGVLTNTPPGDPSFAVSMGLVLRAHATAGRISVRVQNATDPIVAIDPDNLGQVILTGSETFGLKQDGLWGATTTERLAAFFGSLPLSDYAALRAYTGDVKRIYITGPFVSAKPSGIAGMFQYDQTDTTSADNGGTVIVDAEGRRWKRDYDGHVVVKWFGAVGDGVSDDTAAIQAALNTGKNVDFPLGKYRTTSSLTLDISTLTAQNFQSQALYLNGSQFDFAGGANSSWLVINGWPYVQGTTFIVEGGGARISSSNTNTEDCVKIVEGYGHKINNLEARGFENGSAVHLHIADATHWCESIVLTNIRGKDNNFGIRTSVVGGNVTTSFDQTHIANCEFNLTKNNATAFHLSGFHGRTTLHGCGFWANEDGATGSAGFVLDGSFVNATMIGCWGDGDSTAENTITFGAGYITADETNSSMANAMTVIGTAVTGDPTNYLKLPTGWQYKLKVLDHNTIYGSNLYIDEVGGTGGKRNASPGAVLQVSGQFSMPSINPIVAQYKTITLPAGVRRVQHATISPYVNGNVNLIGTAGTCGVYSISTTQVVFYWLAGSNYQGLNFQYDISLQMN